MIFQSEKVNDYILELETVEIGVNNIANSSQVRYTETLRSGSHSFSGYAVGYLVELSGFEVARLDKQPYTNQISVRPNSTVVIASGEATIPHNADGTLSMSVAFSLDIDKNSYTPGPITATGKSMDLTVIPRASSIGATDANIGAVSMIAVGKKSAAYTHSIAYQFGSLSGWLTSSGGMSDTEDRFGETFIPFVLPESFYAQIPSAKSGKCRLTLNTYNGETSIGDPAECEFVAAAAESVCGPMVSGTVTDVNPDTVALTGSAARLVRFYSTALCEMSASARYSAALTERRIGGSPLESGVSARSIDAIETGSISFAVTDSRGYTASETVNVEMIPYIKLTVNPEGHRKNPTDGTASLTVKGIFFHGSFGTADNTLFVQYRLPEGEWTDMTTVIDGDSYTSSAELTGLYYLQAHNIDIRAVDALSEVTKQVTIKKGIPVFDWGENDFRFNVPTAAPSLSAPSVTADRATLRQGATVHAARSGAGQAGYIQAAEIAITAAYADQPIGISYAQRGGPPHKLTLLFTNNGTPTGAEIASFTDQSMAEQSAYLYKAAPGEYRLYIRKAGTYDDIAITEVNIGGYMANKISVKWTDAFAAALPSGALAAVGISPQGQPGPGMYAEAWTVTLDNRGSGSHTFTNPPVLVIVSAQRGGSGAMVTDVWTAATSGVESKMYGYSGDKLDTWGTTVTVSGKTVTVARGGTDSIKYYVTAITKEPG